MQKLALLVEFEASAYEGTEVKKMIRICAAVSSCTAVMAHGEWRLQTASATVHAFI